MLLIQRKLCPANHFKIFLKKILKLGEILVFLNLVPAFALVVTCSSKKDDTLLFVAMNNN